MFVLEFDVQCDNGEWITIFAERRRSPARCSSCCVFGHSNSSCPKLNIKAAADKVNAEGEWTEVRNRRKGKEVAAKIVGYFRGCILAGVDL